MNDSITKQTNDITWKLIASGLATLLLIGCAHKPLTAQEPTVADASAHTVSTLVDQPVEKEIVSGIWLFEDEQLEIKIARVDGAEQFPKPNQNATRFIIESTSDKLISYTTQRFKLEHHQKTGALKTGLTVKKNRQKTNISASEVEDQNIQTTFKGSVVMHAGIPIELTLQNSDIDERTQNIYSRLRMTLTERSSYGERPLNSTIDCVSFPQFQCTRLASQQNAKN